MVEHMSYRNNLSFAPAGIDACALWRMWMPHLNIPHSRFLFTEGAPDINAMSECDIVVVQRLMMEGNVQFLNVARAHGLKIIYDLDDNVWNLPASNPAAHFFHREESVKGLEACAQYADAITVSTKELQQVVRHQWSWMKNTTTGKSIEIIHIDNAIDFKLFQPPVLPRDEDKIVIGWAGSNTHGGDVKLVWELLPYILEKYPNVFLEFVGQACPEKIKFHERVFQRPWIHVSEFHARFATWNWDIALAPLQQHKFNRSKSSIKMQEAGALSTPCLAQDIAPYKYFCSFSKSLDWLLCDDWDWEKKLCTLIEDKSFRKDIGQLAYINTLANFSIERTALQWQELAHTLG